MACLENLSQVSLARLGLANADEGIRCVKQEASCVEQVAIADTVPLVWILNNKKESLTTLFMACLEKDSKTYARSRRIYEPYSL